MKRLAALLLVAGMLLIPMGGSLAEEAAPALLPAAKAAVLIEHADGARIAEKNADEALSVAGLSKLPALVTLAQLLDGGGVSPDAEMHCSSYAASVPGPTAFLDAGETLPAMELFRAAVMISAGDAVMALGENAYGSESVFTDNINATLRLLGIQKTLSDAMGTGVSFTASELALLGGAAARSPSFVKMSAQYMATLRHADGRETELVNANRMIRNFAGCSGLVTGSSPEDGYCGVFYASRGGTGFVAVVLGAASAAARFSDAEMLLGYGFANFRSQQLAAAGGVVVPGVPVRGGEVKRINLVSRADCNVLLDKAGGALTERVEAPEYLTAPVSGEDALGKVLYINAQGALVAEVPLYAEAAVRSYGLLDILRQIASAFVGSAP